MGKYVKLYEEFGTSGGSAIAYTNGAMMQATTTTTINPAQANPLQCVPILFGFPTKHLIESGLNVTYIKAALGIIGRESDFGNSNRFTYLNPLKTLWAEVGGKASVGYGQIKPEIAKKMGIGIDDLNTAVGSLAAVYSIVKANYEMAVSKGYTTEPSSNFQQGTGNAALDIAIAAFNLGPNKIVQYCETNNPNVKKDCTLAGQTIDNVIVSDRPVKNYLPNFKTKRWDKVEISSTGYVTEVAARMKTYTCF